jgi:Acetyltransferase (GNAT) domain
MLLAGSRYVSLLGDVFTVATDLGRGLLERPGSSWGARADLHRRSARAASEWQCAPKVSSPPRGMNAIIVGGFEVRAFEAEDEPGVIEVLQAAFGQWPRDIRCAGPSDFFRWKHTASPFGPSSLIVAVADGAVIGCHAYMPWCLSVGGRVLSTLRGVDLAVHPSCRRLGISMAMRRAASFPDGVAFMWSNPNKHNRPGAHKAGMRAVGNLPRFVRPGGPIGHIVRQAGAKGSRTPDDLRIEAPTAAEALRDGERVSLLLARKSCRGERLVTVKDLSFLRWRYGHFNEYRAITIDPRFGGGGMVIFRVRRQGSFWVSDVCELLVEHGDRRTARHLLHLVGDAAAADFISCGFTSRHDPALFGFVRTRGVTVLMTLPLQQNLTPDPTRRTSWALSRGDLELL